MTEQKPDNIYATPLDRVTEFSFDEAVARVFPDMIQRSVPGYTTIIPMISLLTEQYAQNNTAIYDLGCSLGASTLAMRHGLKRHNATKIIGIDSSASMLERCRHYIELDNEHTPVELKQEDILETQFEPCSVVTLNFTLQFIEPQQRLALLKRICDALVPGGVLILSEKICFESPEAQTTQETLHLQFKKANGYSDLEISQKRSAIENVLIPDTWPQHQQRLSEAGFTDTIQWYQCFNFISMLAIKEP